MKYLSAQSSSAKDQADGIHRVYELAQAGKRPQLKAAWSAARAVLANPPESTASGFLARYIQDVVLYSLSKKIRYDDVFWCCLLYILNEKKVPNCSIGGPLHGVIYRVFDDFDPEDVLE